jgi:hypothetical protein
LYLNGAESLELLPEEANHEEEGVSGDESCGDDNPRVQDASVFYGARAINNVKAEQPNLKQSRNIISFKQTIHRKEVKLHRGLGV